MAISENVHSTDHAVTMRRVRPHQVNMRQPMLARYMRRHAGAMKDGFPWVAGVLLAPGVQATNGTWGPRAYW
eukprot:301509-Pyramimonas_sp.AAC.1